VIVVFIIAGIGVLVAGVLFAVSRSAPNEPDVIGNNSPWPTSLSSDHPPYLPNADMDFNRLSEPEVAEMLRKQRRETGGDPGA
jgi:hypothetical protein